MIDLFEREKLIPMLVSFGLGAASVVLIFIAEEHIFRNLNWNLKGEGWQYLSFIFLRIAVPEEFVKVLAFGFSFLIFRKQFNEPLDYLIYCSLAALGFSALENYLYFNNHGAGLFVGRGILSTVGHMFDTALFAYGIILYRFRFKGTRFWIIPLFFLLSVSAHTFYNFWLLFPGSRPYGYFITVVFFLFTISIYAVILNNALNQSNFFDYRKALNNTRVSGFLLVYYGLLLLIQLAFLTWEYDFMQAMQSFQAEFYIVGFVTITTTLRLSHMQLIQGHWFPVRLELPFSTRTVDLRSWGGFIKIRGYDYNAYHLHKLYQQKILLRPLNRAQSYLNRVAPAKMEEILFFKNNRRGFRTKIWLEADAEPKEYLLVPKLEGPNFNEANHPVVGLMAWKEEYQDLDFRAQLDLGKLSTLEWLLIYPD